MISLIFVDVCTHIYTQNHVYTPPYGQSTNLRVSNAIKTIDVLKMLLAKFKVTAMQYSNIDYPQLCVFGNCRQQHSV